MERVDFEKLVADCRDELFSQVSKLRPAADLARVQEAYYFAEEAHAAQHRKSGEPYITHPIAVARIVCVEMLLGTNSIIAALLHDVVEDTQYTEEDIRDRFGEDVAFLVKVVTKEKKKEYDVNKQLDNFRQMLDSIHYDIRALLLKLADRLHNMRTLSSMRPEKQMKIAGETDYFYAPLANRLGLYAVKSELENLSFRYRLPEEFAKMSDTLNRYIELERVHAEAFIKPIAESLKKNNIRAEVTAKYRSPYSIWRKMQQTGMNFRQLEVKHIINLVFEQEESPSEKNQCLNIYSLITDIYKEKPGSLINYIDTPKENGYQSLHVKVMCSRGTWVEIHISSKRMAYNSRMGCIAQRETGAEKWIEKFKSVLREIASQGKQGGFIEDVVSSFYSDDIVAFTPKGNSVMLPKGATALDLAYEIHTNIGDHAKYARINGKLCSIKTRLHRGDRVDIGTDPLVNPSADWLQSVISFKARRHIAAALRRNNTVLKPAYALCPRCCPIPGDEVVGFSPREGETIIHKRSCPEAISLSARDGESITEVRFDPSEQLYPVRLQVVSVNRNNLLIDLLTVISKELKLSITDIASFETDQIVTTTINLTIHSVNELFSIVSRIEQIKNVEEAKRVSL